MNEFLGQLAAGEQWTLFATIVLGSLKSILKAAPVLEPVFANSDQAQKRLKQIEAAVTFAGWMALVVVFAAWVEVGGLFYWLSAGFLACMYIAYKVMKSYARKRPNPLPAQTAACLSAQSTQPTG